MTFYINTHQMNPAHEISSAICSCIRRYPRPWKELIFLCIGSDRITGDCLGPYIGYKLLQNPIPNVHVYGTLQNPVHALNLAGTSRYISSLHPDGLVIAVDASLGTKKHLGYVTIENGALYPGAGVQKNLPPVGDICITGIVNTAGVLQQLALQTTRLSTVVAMADCIVQGILDSEDYLRLACRPPRHFSPGRLRRETKLSPCAAFTEERR